MGADGHLIITKRESIAGMLIRLILSCIIYNDDSMPDTQWNYTCDDYDKFMQTTITVTFDEEESDDENEEEKDEEKKKETTKSIDMKNYYDLYKNMLWMIEDDCSRDITDRGWDNIREDDYEEVEFNLNRYQEENNYVYYWDNLQCESNDSLAFYFEDFNTHDSEHLIRGFYDNCSKSVKKFKTMFPEFEPFKKMFMEACEEEIDDEDCVETEVWT